MESQSSDEEDQFFDAFDDFQFYDCFTCEQSEPSTSHLPSTLLRRTFSRRGTTGKEPVECLPEASNLEDHSRTNSRDPRYNLFRDLKPNESTFSVTESPRDGVSSIGVSEENNVVESTVTVAENDEPVDQARNNSADSIAEPSESLNSNSRLLLFIAGFVIKAFGFQLNLLISSVTLPISVLSYGYMFIIDPFQAFSHGRAYIIAKLLHLRDSICDYFSPMMNDCINYHKSIWNLVFRFCWGLFWASYVGCVLFGLMFTSLATTGVLMRYLVEEPLEMKEMLNFDYTQTSPVAFVPIVSCAAAGCGAKCMEKIDVGKNVRPRAIPLDHKLKVTVSLTLPESEYNKNLGMFQVRVDFLSINGETLATSSHPCMLKYISVPIRLLLTFFKVAPLVTGYTREAQNLNLKIRGLNEGTVPTACLKVVLEQRAEFRPGAGIPELYDAFLILDSELPFIKRIIWSWRRTIFVWVSMTLFMTEVLFTLVCCSPLLLPRKRTRDGSARSTPTRNSQQELQS
ncbi:NOD26-like intrinsic protein 1,2 isoform 1 [Hibiscus syriacus]|uniref:NOD26-like intrinsic protein 1,2 isoform 1 n=1 Tax=Hibiscus syriacus TaxID=106335 RepID=A0A6A2Y8M0_HIBSY|nr:seipin-2-like [Hibiscus syriacus]XP_039034592.1 seipin-2-like [Hibiscus syriacus]XP_039034593.1 seipin-2-like [Hibiscus syriacus]XP_039034594.1 seipin-2-like [Hibiscus syriacus]KAE8673316.1 NOD26-like intrinsic protein 1,2 isoform 1 [Hibiscus syriacus]